MKAICPDAMNGWSLAFLPLIAWERARGRGDIMGETGCGRIGGLCCG